MRGESAANGPESKVLAANFGISNLIPKEVPVPLVRGRLASQTRVGDRPRMARGPRFAQRTLGFFECCAFEEWRRSRPVSRVLSRTVIPLGASSPIRSSNLPGGTAGRSMASLFGLAPGGVCRAGPLPDSRCALTAPFHPCPHSALPFGEAGTLDRTFVRQAPRRTAGGIFLLHFPSARAAQALPGTVPCGARTFLGTRSRRNRSA